jgi:hypothetical protein
MRVQRRELTRQRAQGIVDDRPDRSQRMLRRHPRLKIDLTEQAARAPVPTTHLPTPHLVLDRVDSYQIAPARATFSAAC